MLVKYSMILPPNLPERLNGNKKNGLVMTAFMKNKFITQILFFLFFIIFMNSCFSVAFSENFPFSSSSVASSHLLPPYFLKLFLFIGVFVSNKIHF